MIENDYWDEEGFDWGWWVILFIVVGIIIYVLTLGTINVSEGRKQVNKEDNRQGNLKTRHRKLNFLIKKKEKLHKKLKRRFRLIYFGVRVVLTLLYLGFNALLYFVFNITDFGDILNWNELALILMAVISFITFGTFTNVRDFVDGIKLKLEVRTFRKYSNIDEELLLHKKEEKELGFTIKKTSGELSQYATNKRQYFIQNKEDPRIE